MKLKMKGIYYLLCCFVLTGSVFAAVPAEHTVGYKGEACFIPEKPRRHAELIGGLGLAKLNAGNSTLGVTSSETDRLVQTNSNSWDTGVGQLGLGYIYYFCHATKYPERVQWFTSVEPELNLYQMVSNSIKGDVWRFQSSAFNQLTYDIPIHSTRLMIDVALTVAAYKRFSFYAKAGIGNAWNRISYSDKDKGISCPNQRVTLNSNTRSNFVWEAGLGLLYDLNDRVGLSLEYLYADLGTVKASSTGTTGTITAPVIVPPQFNLKTQTGLLALHIAL